MPLSKLAQAIYDDLRTNKSPVQYRPLVQRLPALSQPFANLHWQDPRLYAALSELVTGCRLAGRPAISALVVNDSGEPGAGYFSVAHPDAGDRERRTIAHHDELTRVMAHVYPPLQNSEIPSARAATFLLTWRPERWQWRTLVRDIADIASGTPIEFRWSANGTRKAAPGDAMFIVKQGDGQRGIFARATAISEVFVAPHWEKALAATGETSQYVRVRCTELLDPFGPILAIEQLQDAAPDVTWSPRRSCTEISVSAGELLERLWSQRTGIGRVRSLLYPDEPPMDKKYVEGATASVLVNRYERDPAAREACIEHYGAVCQVCSLDFAARYGKIGEGFIHVHHVKPLATVRVSYVVDPVKDLRPVCPNCHAVLHLGGTQEEPMSVAALRERVQAIDIEQRHD